MDVIAKQSSVDNTTVSVVEKILSLLDFLRLELPKLLGELGIKRHYSILSSLSNNVWSFDSISSLFGTLLASSSTFTADSIALSANGIKGFRSGKKRTRV
jgi:hypothetical protein